MAAILQLVFRYILLGITTAIAFVSNYFFNTEPAVTTELRVPTETLSFLFDTPSKPVVIETSPQTDIVKAPKIEVTPMVKPTVVEKPIAQTPAPKPVAVVKPVEKPIEKPLTKTAPITTPIPNTIEAVVNIMCVETLGSLTRTTTGSGVIISPKGIIVTNAHVAKDLMKAGTVCTVRTGSVATHAYKVALVYIPDEWIDNNKEYISSGIARTTTGEHDFALLQITSSATATKLPTTFAYMNVDTGELSVHDEIETIGYPAERIGLFSSLSHLRRVSDDTKVTKIYSFGETESDVFSTGKVSNAEHGSSGGAIIRDGEVVGIIANVNSGTINALSMGYIESYFEKDTKRNFDAIGK